MVDGQRSRVELQVVEGKSSFRVQGLAVEMGESTLQRGPALHSPGARRYQADFLGQMVTRDSKPMIADLVGHDFFRASRRQTGCEARAMLRDPVIWKPHCGVVELLETFSNDGDPQHHSRALMLLPRTLYLPETTPRPITNSPLCEALRRLFSGLVFLLFFFIFRLKAFISTSLLRRTRLTPRELEGLAQVLDEFQSSRWLLRGIRG